MRPAALRRGVWYSSAVHFAADERQIYLLLMPHSPKQIGRKNEQKYSKQGYTKNSEKESILLDRVNHSPNEQSKRGER